MKLLLISAICLLFSPIVVSGQTSGCPDPLALNYNSAAVINDGSCQYAPATVNPLAPDILSDTIMETSGMIWWTGHFWTHNDNTNTSLYALDSATGQIIQAVSLPGVTNYDWEEIAQDDDFIYVGDFGNNGNGNRQDMHILRIAKSGVNTAPQIDTIWFHYEDQTNFTPTGANNTDFDCEAFIATDDSIYLFTKQWIGKKTAMYSLPKLPGSYAAKLRGVLDVQGMITGAAPVAGKRTIALCGYSLSGSMLLPFVYLLYDYPPNRYFSGNKRKIGINAPMHQVEAIASANGTSFYITNEKISVSLLTISPKLQRLNLSSFLSGYYQTLSASKPLWTNETVTIYPNPTEGNLSVRIPAKKAMQIRLKLTDQRGSALIETGKALTAGMNTVMLELPELPDGIYWLSISGNGASLKKKVLYKRK